MPAADGDADGKGAAIAGFGDGDGAVLAGAVDETAAAGEGAAEAAGELAIGALVEPGFAAGAWGLASELVVRRQQPRAA